MARKDPEADRAYHRAYYQVNKAKKAAYTKTYKARQAARDALRYQANKEAIDARSHLWYQTHIEEARAKGRARYAAKKVALLAQQRAYRTAHREEINAKLRAYAASHREERRQYRAANKDKLARSQAARKDRRALTNKAWRAANKEHLTAYGKAHRAEINAKTARRRASKLQAPINDLTVAQWHEIKDAYEHRCVYCHRKMQRLTQDHIIPLVKGGSHTASNVVPACGSCNSKKKDGPPLVPVQPLLFTMAPPRQQRAGS